MNGKVCIHLAHEDGYCYDLTFRHNISLLRGQSSSGKSFLCTRLADRISDTEHCYAYDENSTPVNIYVLSGLAQGNIWQATFTGIKPHSIIFLDESENYVASGEFKSYIEHKDIYIVIVNRDNISSLPYSIRAIYILDFNDDADLHGRTLIVHNAPKYAYSKACTIKFVPDYIVTEDSVSGRLFFDKIYGDSKCFSAYSCSRVARRAQKLVKSDSAPNNTLVIVDGAAFGAHIERYISDNRLYLDKLYLLCDESFEYLLLWSLWQEKSLQDILIDYHHKIDYAKYLSIERFMTAILTAYCNSINAVYNKGETIPDFLITENRVAFVAAIIHLTTGVAFNTQMMTSSFRQLYQDSIANIRNSAELCSLLSQRLHNNNLYFK